MGLQPPAWHFCNTTTNLTGTPSLGTGTQFTFGASNADGSAVSVLSALAHDVHLLTLVIGGSHDNGSGAIDCNSLLDVLTDPAGGTSWGSFIDDLVCGACSIQISSGSGYFTVYYAFPVFIKAGTSIGVRARRRGSSNLTDGRIIIHAHGNPSHPQMWWCGQKVESLGINAGTSTGTRVTSGASGTYGSWATIGTSTHPYGAVQYGVNFIGYDAAADTAATARGYYMQIGYGSQILPGSPTNHFTNSTNEKFARNGFGQLIWCDVAASTAWQLRATASGTFADELNAAIYGVY